MCAFLATACVTNHTQACKCYSALGSLRDSQVLCRPKFKNQKGEAPIAAAQEKPQEKKTKKTTKSYMQRYSHTYIYPRKTTEVTYTA